MTPLTAPTTLLRGLTLAALVVGAGTSGRAAPDTTPNPVLTDTGTSPRPLAHGVFVASPDAPEDAVPEAQLGAYTAATGEAALAYVYLSNNWFYSRQFPGRVVLRVRARGATPIIRLMLRSSDERASGPNTSADTGYGLAEVAGGRLDEDLKLWAGEAARVPGVIYVEYGTEVNGDWFAWNARWNGKDGGAGLFVRAYRHLVNVVRAAGATNVRWIFHVAAQDDPQEPWNRLEAYYPGGDVVSVLGVSAYGAQSPKEGGVQSLRAQLDGVLPRLAALAPGKPVLLLEFGSAARASVSPETWTAAALADLIGGRWPQIRGFSWWDSAWRNDADPSHDTELRVERQPALAAVFRKYLSSGALTRTLDLSPAAH
ncbi:glycoside hydrolase family 26 protein [Deinococcus sp.]|uniref:glycoside hydrolase family 26 protein n=1 Tax=Deinococcus sp. TaxID=47478 RepID=UPI003C7A3EF4